MPCQSIHSAPSCHCQAEVVQLAKSHMCRSQQNDETETCQTSSVVIEIDQGLCCADGIVSVLFHYYTVSMLDVGRAEM